MYSYRGEGIMKSYKERQINFLSVTDSTIFLSWINLDHLDSLISFVCR